MDNPYPGPRAFRKDEHAIFAGRDHEISDLTSLVISHPVVLLYAQSGAGKSSIVHAGLAAAFAERSVRSLPVARVGIPVPSEVPLDEVRNVFTFSMGCDLLPDIPSADIWRRRASLVDIFERIPEAKDDLGEPAITVCALDQFEELFSVYPQRWRDREQFIADIAHLLSVRRDLRILFVLREDHLAAFSDLGRLLPERARTQYRIERLREQEAVAAILKPLEGTTRNYSAGVPEAIVTDLMKVTMASPSGENVAVAGEFVEPVQLQVVCYQLFDRLPKTSTTITVDDYRRYGDPDAALEGFYHQALEAATKSTGVDEGELREWFERELITPIGTRGLVFQGIDSTGNISNGVVAVLEQRHIIRPELRSGARWYELTHDRFIRPIQRSNLAWTSAMWSRSFEAKYSQGIQDAVRKTGVSESELRAFLDTLSDADGKRTAVPAEPRFVAAVESLVDAALLRRDVGDHGSPLYTPTHDALGQAIRLANQHWRAANWSQAVLLRDLDARAARWSKAGTDRKDLLLSVVALREVGSVVAASRVAGIPLSPQLVDYIRASLETSAAVRTKWATWIAVLGGIIALASFAEQIPPLQLRPALLAGVGLICSAFFGGTSGDSEEFVQMNPLRYFLHFLLFGAGPGVAVGLFAPGLSLTVALAISAVGGFFFPAFFLGAFSSSERIEKVTKALKWVRGRDK